MSLYEGAVKKPIMTTLCFVAVMIHTLFCGRDDPGSVLAVQTSGRPLSGY